MKFLIWLGALWLGGLGWASPNAQTYLTLGGTTQAVWFICDGLQTPAVFVVGQPGSANRVRITRFDKRASGRYSYQTYTLGQPDPGAGQVYYALSLGSQQMGSVHAVNPGMLENPSLVYTPPIISLELSKESIECRWVPGTRFLGFSSRRSILISQNAKGILTYQSFDFRNQGKSDIPSLEIRGGKSSAGSFTFENQGYTYRVQITTPGRANLTVRKNGRLLLNEVFMAYTEGKP